MTGSAGVRCLCERVNVRACVFIEQASQKVEALAGWILGETGSNLGWTQLNNQECVDCWRPEKSFFWGLPRAGEDFGARWGSSRL